MMGGNPGSLFEGAPTPVYYTTTNEPSPSFMSQDEPEAVDIYRHAPPRKRNYAVDYTPEISVQVTAKAPTTPTSNTRVVKQVVVDSPTGAKDFWRAHPGRTGPTSAVQACELEQAFQDLRDSETIEIVPEKKKRFPYIPKSIKKAAQKTVNAVKKH
jgi:hypothetical protein